MEAFKKVLQIASAFALLLVAIVSLIGVIIKSKSDEAIAKIPIDATATAEAKLTQSMMSNTTHAVSITETIAPTVTISTKIPTLTLSPSSTDMASLRPTPSPTSVVLLDENFQNGRADDWRIITGSWKVLQEGNGNYVYSGTGDSNWGFVVAGKKTWTDYSFEARFKGMSPTNFSSNNLVWAILGTRVNLERSCFAYIADFSFNNGWVSLGKDGSTCDKSFPGSFQQPEMGRWYSIRFDVRANTMKLYMDGNFIGEEDDSELQSGYVGLAVGPNNTVYFDDIRVTEIQP